MSTHRYLHPQGVDDSFRGFASRTMPAFVVDQIVRRLRFVCLSIIGVSVFVALTYRSVFTHRDSLADAGVVAGCGIALAAAGIVLVLQRRPRTQKQLVAIAIAFEAIVAFASALPNAFWHYPDTYMPDPRPFFSGIWLLMCPLIVPLSPRLAFGSVLASVALVMSAFGLPFLFSPERVPPLVVVRMAFETHLMVGALAYCASRMVNHLNWQIANERKKGSYELVHRLGEGAMGEVWLARHRMLHRPAAMKIIHRDRLETATDELREEVTARFEREAQATASLYSQHSISLYDFGTMEDGSFFYVMEALDGMNLSDLVEEHGPLSPARTVHLLLQVCDSLAEAHGIGLIHRDLKPANIHVCRYGLEADFIKVLDFGMVKFAEDPTVTKSVQLPSPDSLSPDLTHEGHIAGTPAFMAPEMIRMEKIDHRYDIYALGCVAYWLLTGTHVFKVGSFERQMAAHLKAVPEPVSQRRGSPVPAALEELIMQCLAKQPDERPGTVAEIAARLRAIELGETWTREEAKRWWKENVPARNWGAALQAAAARTPSRPGADPTAATAATRRIATPADTSAPTKPSRG